MWRTRANDDYCVLIVKENSRLIHETTSFMTSYIQHFMFTNFGFTTSYSPTLDLPLHILQFWIHDFISINHPSVIILTIGNSYVSKIKENSRLIHETTSSITILTSNIHPGQHLSFFTNYGFTTSYSPKVDSPLHIHQLLINHFIFTNHDSPLTFTYFDWPLDHDYQVPKAGLR